MRNPFDRDRDDRPEHSAGASAPTSEAGERHVRPDARHDTTPVIPRQRTAEGPYGTGPGTDVRVAGRPATPTRGPAAARPDTAHGEDEASGPAAGRTGSTHPAGPAGLPDPSRRPDPSSRPDPEAGTDLVDPAAAERLRSRWRDVQAAFVDDPKDSVRQAERLITEALTAISEAVQARTRESTETGASGGPGGDANGDSRSAADAQTERLRRLLREQRDVLHRLIGS